MLEKYEKRIMKLLARPDYRPVKVRLLSHALNIDEGEYAGFCQAVKQMTQQGRIAMGLGNIISLPQMPERIVGIYRSARKGFGFILPDTAYVSGDLYIPQGRALDAINGDRVKTKVFKRRRRDGTIRYTDEIIKVVDRETSQFVGTLFNEGRDWFIRPDGKV